VAGENLKVEIMVGVRCVDQSNPLKDACLVSVGSCEAFKDD